MRAAVCYTFGQPLVLVALYQSGRLKLDELITAR
jgi:hypothetical protein